MLKKVEGSGAKWWVCGPFESLRMYLCGEMRSQLAKLPGWSGRELVRRAAGDSEGG